MTPKAHPDTAAPYGWMAGVSLAFVACYWLSNRLTSVRADVGDAVFGWERGIPLVPWTIVPYLSICGFFVLSFFVGRDRQELQRHIARLLLVLVISINCCLLFPLRFTFERPATSEALGLLFQRWRLSTCPTTARLRCTSACCWCCGFASCRMCVAGSAGGCMSGSG